MKFALISTTALLLAAAGCATYRTIEVKAARIEVESPNSNGLTPTVAEALFREIASQVGLAVRGPMQVSKVMTEYTAKASGTRPAIALDLVMWVDTRSIRFESSTYGTAKDLSEARKVAKLFGQALEKRGVGYQARELTAIPPLLP